MSKNAQAKICQHCNQNKEISKFSKNIRRKDGIHNWCKNCCKISYKIYYEKNKNKIKQRKKRYNKTNETKIQQQKKQYRKENKKQISDYNKMHYASNQETMLNRSVEYKKKNISKWMLTQSKQRAKSKNIAHTITSEHIENKLEECKNNNGEYICPVLGIKMQSHVGKGYKRGQDNSLSLDRINSNKGYIPSNIAIISFRANVLKSNGTAEEHLKIAAFILDSMESKNVID